MNDAPLTYRESYAWTRRELVLSPGKVAIVTKQLGGTECGQHVPLARLSPEFGYMLFRSPRVFYGFALFAGLVFFLWRFVRPFELPWTEPRVLVIVALAVASLGFGLAYLPRYRAYYFVNESGQPVLSIIESGPDRARCREFVERVSQAIRDAAADRPESA